MRHLLAVYLAAYYTGNRQVGILRDFHRECGVLSLVQHIIQAPRGMQQPQGIGMGWMWRPPPGPSTVFRAYPSPGLSDMPFIPLITSDLATLIGFQTIRLLTTP